MVDDVQDYLLMDPRVHEVNGREMVKKMRQNIEIMLHQKKHAIQVRSPVCCVECNTGNIRCAVCRVRLYHITF